MADHLKLKGEAKALKALVSNSAANDTILWSCAVTKARAWHAHGSDHGAAACARHAHSTCMCTAQLHVHKHSMCVAQLLM